MKVNKKVNFRKPNTKTGIFENPILLADVILFPGLMLKPAENGWIHTTIRCYSYL